MIALQLVAVLIGGFAGAVLGAVLADRIFGGSE